jgi:hypothetical protein
MAEEYRIVEIETDDDGYVCQSGRLANGPVSKYGNRPLFPLKYQKFVPLEDVERLLKKAL